MAFRVGKIPPHVLKSNVLSQLGSPSSHVLVGPAVGEDCAVLRLSSSSSSSSCLLAAKTDPVTGASSNVGRLAVHVNANDLAASGASPQFFLLTALFPAGTSMEEVRSVQQQVHETCLELGVAVVGGHTELTESVARPVLVGCMLGELMTKTPIRTSGARPGDLLVLTKGVGIEGVSILLSDRADHLKYLFGGSLEKVAGSAKRFGDMLSVVPESKIAVSSVPEGAISSMHDPTEGGLAGALHEVADAANRGFEIDEESIPISEETKLVANHYGVSALELISSGALLLAVDPSHADRLLLALQNGNILASKIGVVVEDANVRSLRGRNGVTRPLPRPEQDALWSCVDKQQ